MAASPDRAVLHVATDRPPSCAVRWLAALPVAQPEERSVRQDHRGLHADHTKLPFNEPKIIRNMRFDSVADRSRGVV